MKSSLSLALTTILFLSSCASGPTQKADAQAAAPSPNAASIEASQAIEFPMTAAEKKKLAADYKKAMAAEQKAFNQNEKAALKSANKDQAARKKTWHAQEKKARRAYFDQHMSGPERRQYVQDYLKRKAEFEKGLQGEMDAVKASWKEKRDYLKQFQKERETQFKATLDQNKRPDASLWPKS